MIGATMTHKDLQDRGRRLEQVNEILLKLDPSIRADAFRTLEGYITSAPTSDSSGDPIREQQSDHARVPATTRESFFGAHQGGKPATNALVICAYIYSVHGPVLVCSTMIKKIADDVGLIVPARIDMTLTQAQREGKSIFKAEGDGKFRPTVHGELFLQKTYGVKKGRAPLEDDQ